MRTAIVPAHALSAKDLRASHYVANPKQIARRVVLKWRDEFPVLDIRSDGGKRLLVLIEEAVREGMAKR